MILQPLRIGAFALATLVAVTAPSLAQTANTETVKNFYAAFGQNKPELLDKVLATDWVDIPPNQGQEPGRDAFKPFIAGYHTMFSDLNVVNDQIIDAGEYVIVRSTISGTQAAPFAGFASKGRPFSVMAVDIHQFKDGMVIKTWHVEDWLSGMFQMGSFE
ncbi:MAG: ester cyclase [Cypionkella sp.]